MDQVKFRREERLAELDLIKLYQEYTKIRLKIKMKMKMMW